MESISGTHSDNDFSLIQLGFMAEYEDDQIKYTIGKKAYVYSHQDYDETLPKYSLYVNGSAFIFLKTK